MIRAALALVCISALMAMGALDKPHKHADRAAPCVSVYCTATLTTSSTAAAYSSNGGSTWSDAAMPGDAGTVTVGSTPDHLVPMGGR